MGIHVIVRRELRLDVRQCDEAAEAHHEAFENLRHEDFAIHHRRVIALDIVAVQKLVAPQAIGRGVAVVGAIDAGHAEAPVDMVLLHRVGRTLDIEHGLVEVEAVGLVIIGAGRIAALLGVGGEIAADGEPAIGLHAVIGHGLADLGVGDGDHQRAVNGGHAGAAQGAGAAIGPVDEGIGRRIDGLVPALAARWRG